MRAGSWPSWPGRLHLIAALYVLSTLVSIPELQAQSRIEEGFARVINQFRWTSSLTVHEQSADWSIHLVNHFRSDAFVLFNDRLSFRDEDLFSLSLRRPYKSTEIVIYGQGGWYSLSKVVSTSAYGGLRIGNPVKYWFEPLLGVALDRRPGIRNGNGLGGGGGSTLEPDPLRTDIGPAIGFNARLPLSNFDGYDIEISGLGRYEILSPRRSDRFRVHGEVTKTYNQLRTQTLFKLSSVRRDTYQGAPSIHAERGPEGIIETIKSTRSDTLDIGFDVDQSISSSFSIGGRLSAALTRRRVRILSPSEEALVFETDFNRNDIGAEIMMQYAKGDYFLRFSLHVGAQEEQRNLVNQDDLPTAQAARKTLLLRQAEFDRGVVEARLRSRFPLGGSSRLRLDISTNIVRHDTPEVNPDDRDELFYRGVIGTTTRLTDGLEVQLQLFGTYFHTVYLKSVRSADNNVQRSLRFRPSIRWRPRARTRIELISQVRATYTVDDFVLPGRRSTDQSARELRYDLELEHGAGETATFKFTGRISDLRLGRFLEDSFAEIPFDTLITTNLWGRIEVGREIQAEIGYRSFVRSDFDRALTLKYPIPFVPGDEIGPDSTPDVGTITRKGRRTISQTGPTGAITWRMRRNSHLRFEGWAILQRINFRLYGELPDQDAEAIRDAASKGTSTVIPNLSVSMLWRF